MGDIATILSIMTGILSLALVTLARSAKDVLRSVDAAAEQTAQQLEMVARASAEIVTGTTEAPSRTLAKLTARKKSASKETPAKPPKKAQLFLRFALKPKDQEVILGDMEEQFHIIMAEHGQRAARTWYIWQAARTVAAQLASKLIRWGVVATITDTIRRFVS